MQSLERFSYKKIQLSRIFLKINRFWIGSLLIILTGTLALQHSSQALERISTDILFNCTNAIRQEKGLEKLYLNEQLNQAAHQKLLDMEEYRYWAHQNPITGKTPWEFMDESGFYYIYAGENLAVGFELSEQMCEAWKNSPSHLSNMISRDFQEIGFAYQTVDLGEKSGVLVVQMFGTRLGFEKNESLTYDCSNSPSKNVFVLHPSCGSTLEQEDTLLVYNPMDLPLEIHINGTTMAIADEISTGDFTRYIFDQPFSLGSQHVVINNPLLPAEQVELKFLIDQADEEKPSLADELSANIMSVKEPAEAISIFIILVLGFSAAYGLNRRKATNKTS